MADFEVREIVSFDPPSKFVEELSMEDADQYVLIYYPQIVITSLLAEHFEHIHTLAWIKHKYGWELKDEPWIDKLVDTAVLCIECSLESDPPVHDIKTYMLEWLNEQLKEYNSELEGYAEKMHEDRMPSGRNLGYG